MARIDATRDEADLVRYFTANAAAFGVPFRPGELTAKRPVVDPSRYLMAAVDGETAGVAGSFGFDLTLPGGAEVPVDHVGDPPELFGPRIPVVLEGTFEGDRFASDEILVRHDNAYDEANPDRIQQAEQDAQQGAAG